MPSGVVIIITALVGSVGPIVVLSVLSSLLSKIDLLQYICNICDGITRKKALYHHTGGFGVVLLVYDTFYTSYKYIPLALISMNKMRVG